jgi:hypothetical protein
MFLAVDKNGNISYVDEKDKTSDKNTLWKLIKPKKWCHPKEPGFYLVSSDETMVMEYNPTEGEEVKAKIFDPATDHTVWHISPDSEIYCYSLNPEDGLEDRRYLWTALEGVYVTPDEHLAEKWVAKTNIVLNQKSFRSFPLCYVFFVIVAVIFLYIFL